MNEKLIATTNEDNTQNFDTNNPDTWETVDYETYKKQYQLDSEPSSAKDLEPINDEEQELPILDATPQEKTFYAPQAMGRDKYDEVLERYVEKRKKMTEHEWQKIVHDLRKFADGNDIDGDVREAFYPDWEDEDFERLLSDLGEDVLDTNTAQIVKMLQGKAERPLRLEDERDERGLPLDVHPLDHNEKLQELLDLQNKHFRGELETHPGKYGIDRNEFIDRWDQVQKFAMGEDWNNPDREFYQNWTPHDFRRLSAALFKKEKAHQASIPKWKRTTQELTKKVKQGIKYGYWPF